MLWFYKRRALQNKTFVSAGHEDSTISPGWDTRDMISVFLRFHRIRINHWLIRLLNNPTRVNAANAGRSIQLQLPLRGIYEALSFLLHWRCSGISILMHLALKVTLWHVLLSEWTPTPHFEAVCQKTPFTASTTTGYPRCWVLKSIKEIWKEFLYELLLINRETV